MAYVLVGPTMIGPVESSTLCRTVIILRSSSTSFNLSARASPTRKPPYARRRTSTRSRSRLIAIASRSTSAGERTGRSICRRFGRLTERNTQGFDGIALSLTARSSRRLRTPTASIAFVDDTPSRFMSAIQSSI